MRWPRTCFGRRTGYSTTMSLPQKTALRPEFSPRSVLRAIWKHRLIAVTATCLVATIGVLIVHNLPSVYEAGALILVDPQKIPDRFVSSTISEDFSDRLATMNQEILSATRLKKIISEFDLYRREQATHVMDDIIEMMRKDIEVTVEKSASGNRPGAFRITYRATDPVLAARVVERITGLYIEENLKDREMQSEGTSDFLDAQLNDAKRTLDQQEGAVSRYKIEHNGELPEQENSLQTALARLQTELQGNDDALNRAQQTKITLESAVTSSRAIENALRERARVSAHSAVHFDPSANIPEPILQSEAISAQLAAARARYGDQHPDVRRLRDQLEAALQHERELASKTPGRPATEESDATTAGASDDPELLRAHEHTVQLENELNGVRQEIERRTSERNRILRDSASYQRRVEAIPLREQEYAGLTRDYDFSKTNYRMLLDKKMAAEMATSLEKRQQAERFRILDPARPPQKPIKPKRTVMYAASVAGGVVLAIALCVLLEMRNGVLLGEWELPAGTPIVARVSRISGNSPESSSKKVSSALVRRVIGTVPVFLLFLKRTRFL